MSPYPWTRTVTRVSTVIDLNVERNVHTVHGHARIGAQCERPFSIERGIGLQQML